MTTVLVTGAGAIIGYGVLKSLADQPGIRTIAADTLPHAVGKHFADAFVKAPLTSDPSYSDWLNGVISEHSVDLMIPCIEQDVSWLAAAVLSGAEFETKLCLNDPNLIRLSTDKLAFDEFLERQADPVRIPSSTSCNFDELAATLGLPFLLKPRKGYASKGLVRIECADDFLLYHDRMGSIYLAQRIIGNDDTEFTVSAFCVSGDVHAAIALRRYLAPDGSTQRAQTADITPFMPTLVRLSKALCAQGPTNFQFRCEGETPYLLEINPRISSATSLRAAFGYNEASMCIEHYVNASAIVQPTIRSGQAIRYIEDIIVDGTGDSF